MELQLEQFREQQKDSWNKFSPGWKKWDELMMDFLKPMGNEIIKLIRPKEGDYILDIAAGTGEPGLTIASMIPEGKVIATDLAEKMLDVAMENAFKRGIKNFETRVCDVSDLPFEENTFDAISCRFGFMFFPDMLLAAKEMYRVLKPNGKIATSVWSGPEKNFWVTAIGSTINKNLNLPLPSPDSPGMFRCSQNGLIQNIFKEAGFKNTSESEITGVLKCGTADVYWNMLTEVAAPFVSALSKADDEMRAKIRKEVYSLVEQKYNGQNVDIGAASIVVFGEKI